MLSKTITGMFGLVAALAQVASAQTNTYNIVPAGDSITRGCCGNSVATDSYRKTFESLMQVNACPYVLKGSQTQASNTSTYMSAHEGYSGWWAHHFIRGHSSGPRSIELTLRTELPDVILMHMGSNDLSGTGPSQPVSVDQTLDNIKQVINIINSTADDIPIPRPTILLAKPIPWYGLSDDWNKDGVYDNPNIETDIELLGELISLAIKSGFPTEPGGISRQAFLSNVFEIDVFTNYDEGLMQSDGIHPNRQGEDFIAEAFFQGMVDAGLCAYSRDEAIPFAEATSPASGTSIPPSNTEISGTAGDIDSGINRVRVRVQRLGVSPAQFWNGSEWTSTSAFPDAVLSNDGTAWTLPSVDLTQPGNYRVRINARDNASNTARARDNPKTDFSVGSQDLTPPSAQTTYPANSESIEPTTTAVSGISSDSESGVQRVRVRVQRLGTSPAQYWNGSEWTSTSTFPDATLSSDGTAWSLPNVDLTQSGNYRVRINARDNARNTARARDNPKTDFSVGSQDLTPPSAQTTYPANNDSIMPTATTTITGTSSDADSGVKRVRVRVQRLGVSPARYWNGSAWTSASATVDAELNTDGTAWTLPAVELSEPGNYRIRIIATDLAGNTSRAFNNPKTDFSVN